MAEGHPCPRCKAPLAGVVLAGGVTRIDRCTSCSGCFVRSRDFGELVELEEAGDGGPREALVGPPARHLSPESLFEIVACPHCHREMDRIRFAQRASLVVDLCAAHGLWLDAGEFPAVLDFVKQRKAGAVSKGPAELADEANWKQMDERNSEMRREVSIHTSHAEEAIFEQRVRTRIDFDD